MPLVGFEPTISEGERSQTYALDRAAIATGIFTSWTVLISEDLSFSKILYNFLLLIQIAS